SFTDLGIAIQEDLHRYTYDITIPRSVLDPGRQTWRLYGGAGLWDATQESWLQVLPGLPTPSMPGGGAPGLPNIFDLLFHGGGPVYPTSNNGSDFNYWDDEQQAQDLAASDISRDHADLDFGLLRP